MADEENLNEVKEEGRCGRSKEVYDRDSGRSRDFGFVTYNYADEVKRAVDALNGVLPIFSYGETRRFLLACLVLPLLFGSGSPFSMVKCIQLYQQVINGLWLFSIIGSYWNFLTLFCISFVLLHTVLVFYEKYEDKVDNFAEKVEVEIKKQYAVFNVKVLNKK